MEANVVILGLIRGAYTADTIPNASNSNTSTNSNVVGLWRTGQELVGPTIIADGTRGQ